MYVGAMDREIKEPAATIRAELARRRRTVGWLSAATGISAPTLHRRLANPGKFDISELAAIATAMELDPEHLFRVAFPVEATS